MRNIILPNQELLLEVSRILSDNSDVVIRAKGNSMLPFIRGGRDSVRLRKAGVLREKEIVLAEITPGHFVIHRVLRIEDQCVTLMGDGNLGGVEHCRREDVKGSVVRVIRTGREIDCNCRRERLKASVWIALMPVRKYLLLLLKLGGVEE